jgi:hypothetical protein
MQALPRKPSDLAKRAAGGGRRRVGDDFRARVEHLQAVGPRLPAELGAQVGGAEHERDHTRARRRLVREPQTLGRLHDRDHRRALGAERGDRIGRRLREDERLQGELARRREIVLEPGRARAVDPDDRRAEPKNELARLVLAVGRDGVLEVGDDGVGVRRECLRQLRLVGAGREEQRAESFERSRARFMSDIQRECQTRPVGCSLTRA